MDYRCPCCSVDLKNKLMPTTGIGRLVLKLPAFIGGDIRQQVANCPNCHTSLKRNLHPLDTALVRWGAAPFIVFIIGLVLESLTVQMVAALLLVVGAVWASWGITRPAYKKWMAWREVDDEP